MSHAISLQRPLVPHQNALQLEQDQRAGNSTCFGSASKATIVALGVIASIASFAFLPVVSALLATGLIVILGTAALSCFSRRNPGPSPLPNHNHSHASTIPLYNRIFTPYHRHHAPFCASSGTRGNVPIEAGVPPRAPAPRSDVPVNPHAGRGRGIFGGLGLGRGHNPPTGPGGPGTVGVGRGHNPPAGRGGPGTVGIGSGHNPPVRPSGPGTVGVGRGHNP